MIKRGQEGNQDNEAEEKKIVKRQKKMRGEKRTHDRGAEKERNAKII